MRVAVVHAQFDGSALVDDPHVAIVGVQLHRGIHVVNIRSTRMLMAHGFLNRIFEVFNREETAVDMLASSEVSVSLTIDNPARLAAICDGLRQFADVSVEHDQAIVCIVGDNIRHTPGVAARAFGVLGTVNIRMISQGASRVNLGFVVAGDDLEKSVALLHEEFGEHHYGRVDMELKPGQKERAIEHFSDAKVKTVLEWSVARREDLDGIKLYLDETGWLMLRASGTEPMLRVYSETRSAAATRKILEETRAIVQSL